ncbi:hypothetical protein BGW36DRAFT_398082 [Talaromyces proteolyticus]|uniref:Uncharacterized protein n=1 Tax=Talaromyces proteolyticus TaxID=1131652 RepID=A0AAD4Q018_9EURO|nr:uncharacterized protein BGW36DRAFT_398082 [Talaromyces proteolyticus]KAH8696561.1 hypothetical protein BGW36DRAFT_398082 [Talaromyces proteolyticus]
MPSLVFLAEELLAQARRIEEALEQSKISHTSFEKDTLELLPDDIQMLRWDLVDTSHTFRQLLRGARLSGLDIAYSWTEQLIQRIVWRYKLASVGPINSCATYDEISETSGLGRSAVLRTIRAAMTLNIFDESESGKVCHTAISRLLATDEGYYHSVGLQLEDIGPASLKLIEAWEKFGEDSGEPNQNAFSLNNDGRSLFTLLAEEPERAHRFDAAMKYAVEAEDFNFSQIMKAFDRSTLDKSGSGQISQALGRKIQNLSLTVQELPHVVEQGRKKLPSEFNGRISFEAQNFMDPQQSERAPDAYLISRLEVLIWDSVLGDSPVKKLSGKFNLRQDFIMATISNGKDRSVEQFRRVLELSDERFVTESIQRPEGCKLSMIEISWNC